MEKINSDLLFTISHIIATSTKIILKTVKYWQKEALLSYNIQLISRFFMSVCYRSQMYRWDQKLLRGLTASPTREYQSFLSLEAGEYWSEDCFTPVYFSPSLNSSREHFETRHGSRWIFGLVTKSNPFCCSSRSIAQPTGRDQFLVE